MNDRKEKYFLNFSIILILAAAFGVAYVLFLLPEDISLGGKEERYIFGATYMTMNNPFYQTVDSQMRADIEKNGDVLLTRDAAMNQDRQNEEIRELINSGAEVIFLTPVEWDHASEGIEAARAAGVKIIVVDTFVSNPESVTCSVVSDNYQAGVLCAGSSWGIEWRKCIRLPFFVLQLRYAPQTTTKNNRRCLSWLVC